MGVSQLDDGVQERQLKLTPPREIGSQTSNGCGKLLEKLVSTLAFRPIAMMIVF